MEKTLHNDFAETKTTWVVFPGSLRVNSLVFDSVTTSSNKKGFKLYFAPYSSLSNKRAAHS